HTRFSRDWSSDVCSSDLHIVTFRKLVFDGIQQEVVLLLGERQDCESARIRVLELDTAADLANANLEAATPSTIDLEHSREKWIRSEERRVGTESRVERSA